ncbi:MAG: hypothetical protein ABI947_22920 [Chloroflexota bacterium]
MTKKNQKSTPKPPTIITLTLPDEGNLPRTATLLIQRGTLAAVRQFDYSDLTGITHAIQEAAAQFMEVEKNPPPDFNSVSTSISSTTPLAVTDSDSSEGEGDPDQKPDDDIEPTADLAVQISVDTPAVEPAQPVNLTLF